MNYNVGDQLLLRNYNRKSKFDSCNLPEKFVIMEVLTKEYIFFLVKSLNIDKCLMRHQNDVKIFEDDIPDHNAVPENSDNNIDWKSRLNLNPTMTMSIILSLNKTVILSILLCEDQTEYVNLIQGTTMMILLHKTCVYISRALNTMYPSPIGHLLAMTGNVDDALIVLLSPNDVMISYN